MPNDRSKKPFSRSINFSKEEELVGDLKKNTQHGFNRAPESSIYSLDSLINGQNISQQVCPITTGIVPDKESDKIPMAEIEYEIPHDISPSKQDMILRLKQESESFIEIDSNVVIQRVISHIRATIRSGTRLSILQEKVDLQLTQSQRELLYEILEIKNQTYTDEQIIKFTKDYILGFLEIDRQTSYKFHHLISIANKFDQLYNKFDDTISDILIMLDFKDRVYTADEIFSFAVMLPEERKGWLVQHHNIRQDISQILIDMLDIDSRKKHSIEDMKALADEYKNIKSLGFAQYGVSIEDIRKFAEAYKKSKLSGFFRNAQPASGIQSMAAMESLNRQMYYENKYTTAQTLKFILMSPEARELWIEINKPV